MLCHHKKIHLYVITHLKWKDDHFQTLIKDYPGKYFEILNNIYMRMMRRVPMEKILGHRDQNKL